MNKKHIRIKKKGIITNGKGFFEARYEGQGEVLIPNNMATELEPLCLSQTEATACIRKRFEQKST